jgi:hypothetical protein
LSQETLTVAARQAVQMYRNVRLSRLASVGLVAFAITVYFILLFTAVESAFSIGISAADDEATASIAKNLAYGYGYSVSIHWDGFPGVFPFPWGTVAIGPTLVLPAAVLIKIFGNEPWVPGLTTVLEITILLFILTWVHARRISSLSAAGYMLLFGLLCFALVGDEWFVIWYDLLGEMPAALLVIVGATLWVGNPEDRTTIALSGFCFGLAFMAKFISVLGVLPMGGWLAMGLFRDRHNRGRALSLIMIAAACFLIPLSSFELWRLATLGPSAFVEVWRDIFAFIGSNGLSGSLLHDLIGHASGKLTLVTPNIHLSPLLILSLLIASGFVALGSANARPIYAYFAAAALLHWTWWIFVSPSGWFRYMLIGLVYQAAALASLAYAVQRRQALVAVAIALILGLHYPDPLGAISSPIRRSIANRFKASPELTHLREAAELLEHLPGKPKFVTAWWVTGVGLEYMLPTVGNFIRSDRVSIETRRSTPLYVVQVARWGAIPDINGFSEWERLCQDVIFDKKPIRIAKCPLTLL